MEFKLGSKAYHAYSKYTSKTNNDVMLVNLAENSSEGEKLPLLSFKGPFLHFSSCNASLKFYFELNCKIDVSHEGIQFDYQFRSNLKIEQPIKFPAENYTLNETQWNSQLSKENVMKTVFALIEEDNLSNVSYINKVMGKFEGKQFCIKKKKTVFA
ncbi:hypothetical protein HMI55_002828 [Coelomomyces lativittatus]|nr:hypothetical protein HMI55_002828 [Coelomomyces lativittatus]